MTISTKGPAMMDGMRHREWMTVAADERRRLLELLPDLSPGEWHARTDCTEWDVRQVVAHLAGAAWSTASLREAFRQQRLGKRRRPGADVVDGMNQLQVEERAGTSPADLVAEIRDATEAGLEARRRLPAPIRMLRVPFGPPLGMRSIGYLMDRIYTRDSWMHRVDICRATSRPLMLSPGHDGRLVADVVAEWADIHRQPYALTLTGPAGGHWSSKPADTSGLPERLEMDAVEFCRVVSGRAPGTGLLAHHVPF